MRLSSILRRPLALTDRSCRQYNPERQPAAAPQNTRQNLADQARRSTLIAYGGREALQAPGGSNGAGSETGNAGIAGDGSTDPAVRSSPNALDALRQSSAVGEARASMLPNRNYLVTGGGTLIPCILQTAMNSAQPGYTSCLIPRDVYSENGRVVLMEKGTKVLGEYHGGIQQGQNRLFVLWTRAVTPQGVRIDLASPGSDALGRAGIAGSVDTFFWARFGSALLLSLVGRRCLYRRAVRLRGEQQFQQHHAHAERGGKHRAPEQHQHPSGAEEEPRRRGRNIRGQGLQLR